MASRTVPISDFCSFEKGLSYKGKHLDEDGPLLLGIGTINEGGGFKTQKLRTYGGPYKTQHIVEAGDVYVAMTNMAEETSKFLGSAARLPASLVGTGIITHHVCKVKWKTNDPVMQDFLYWIMRSDYFLSHCRNFGSGTTVYSTRAKDAERFEVPAKLNSNQITLTKLLNSISKLEEGLEAKSELIQSKMECLFRSWFMDFDPVKAKAEGKLPYGMDEETAALFPDSFKNSEIGLIPTGWSVSTIHDISKQRKDIVKPDEFNHLLPYIGLQHMPRKSIALTEWGNSVDVVSNKFRFSKKDILFGKLRPYFHKVGPAPLDGVCSTDILVIQPIDEKLGGFLIPILSSEHFVNFVSGISEGVGLPRTKWAHFKLYKFALPPVEIREKFSLIVDLMLHNIDSFIDESKALDQMRNSLLKGLMSRENL
jgi:type I restriction enzyme S subunit